MHIYTRSRVAIAAILDVAVHGAGQPVSLTRLSAYQDVSVSYLEQLFSKLREKGIVASQRGPSGGYRLGRDLATISVADVMDAVDGAANHCGACQGVQCLPGSPGCAAGGLWCGLNDHLASYLRSVSLAAVLADLGDAQRPREPVAAPPPPAVHLPIRPPESQRASTAGPRS